MMKPAVIIVTILFLLGCFFSTEAQSEGDLEKICWPTQVTYTVKGIRSNESNNEPPMSTSYSTIYYIDATPGMNRFRYEQNSSLAINGHVTKTTSEKELSYQKEETTAYYYHWIDGNCYCNIYDQTSVVNCNVGNISNSGNGEVVLSYNETVNSDPYYERLSGDYYIKLLPEYGANIGQVLEYSGSVEIDDSSWARVNWGDFSEKTDSVQFSVNNDDFVVPASWNCPPESACKYSKVNKQHSMLSRF